MARRSEAAATARKRNLGFVSRLGKRGTRRLTNSRRGVSAEAPQFEVFAQKGADGRNDPRRPRSAERAREANAGQWASWRRVGRCTANPRSLIRVTQRSGRISGSRSHPFRAVSSPERCPDWISRRCRAGGGLPRNPNRSDLYVGGDKASRSCHPARVSGLQLHRSLLRRVRSGPPPDQAADGRKGVAELADWLPAPANLTKEPACSRGQGRITGVLFPHGTDVDVPSRRRQPSKY